MKKMKWTIATCIFAMFAVFLMLSNAAMALPAFTLDKNNEMFFKNVENIYSVDDSGSLTLKDPDAIDTKIEVGDVFQGIAGVQDISVDGLTTWSSSSSDQFSGYFLMEVASIVQGTGADTIGFAPFSYADPESLLSTGVSGGANEVFAFYTDDNGAGTTMYETNGTWSDDLAKATDGNLWATFGLGMGDTYWYAAANDDFSPTYGNTIALGFAGLDMVQNNTGIDNWDYIDDPNEGGTSNVQMFFQIEIQRTDPNGVVANTYDFLSNDPAESHPVPEPATMLLLGSGLIGLAGLSRKKKFFKKD